jgi:hypothetical protein
MERTEQHNEDSSRTVPSYMPGMDGAITYLDE